MPGMGTRYQTDEPRYADLLSFPVSRFRMYLVFYRPVAGGIEVRARACMGHAISAASWRRNSASRRMPATMWRRTNEL